MIDIFNRHQRVALQFSGGKDSMACLYLLRPYLDRITVYWVNAGDEFPETVAVIERCKSFIPNFVEVSSDSVAWREKHGVVSDLVPTDATPLAKIGGFGSMLVSDRFACCFSNLMKPMYERMQADRITCVIRGQKLCDMPRVPFRSGDSQDGVEFFYPIEGWSNDDVFAYLRSVDAPIHPCYDFGSYGANCSTCTAWWNESQHEFRRVRHPEIHSKVLPVMAQLRGAIQSHWDALK